MKKIIFTLLVLLAIAGVAIGLFVGLGGHEPKPLSNEEIINQTRYCEAWGLKANYVPNIEGVPTKIFCVPK